VTPAFLPVRHALFQRVMGMPPFSDDKSLRTPKNSSIDEPHQG
jgi:hypothetical protein